jgi:septal ring factor EnvC (AmiA/AmiB activator)
LRTPQFGRIAFAIPTPPSIRQAAVALLCTLLACALPAPAKETRANASAVAEKREDLKGLHRQIEKLQKNVSAAESRRADAADQLRKVEQEISGTQRELHRLATQRGDVQATLATLATQSRELESRLQRQQTQLEKLVRHQYLHGRSDALHLLLNGEDPNQTARDLYYLTLIAEARRTLVADIGGTLQNKQALAQEARLRGDELAAIEARQKEQHGKLVAQREQRKGVMQSISTQITEQRREIGNLQRDEKQLSQLIERLAKAAAAKPAQRREAQVSAARPTRPAGAKGAPEPAAVGAFGGLKGSLHLPARGVVSNRFGGPRQEGGVWKGLFIRSNSGSEVKAVAGGQVVFADWMRGFGNLMIVDHGESYLSVYGNNEALLKDVGEKVRAGETIAAVGNSGGSPESGLYFELRYQGQALDPLKWINLR